MLSVLCWKSFKKQKDHKYIGGGIGGWFGKSGTFSLKTKKVNITVFVHFQYLQ